MKNLQKRVITVRSLSEEENGGEWSEVRNFEGKEQKGLIHL